MATALRPFQQKLDYDIDAAWNAGAQCVMAVAATGSGKTVVLSKKLLDHSGYSAAIAHRQELVSQISKAVARNGVRHRIIGAKKGSALTRIISAMHVEEFGYSLLDPGARVGVGGVDTIIRMDDQDSFFKQVGFGVQDESHHVLRNNKWGKCINMFRKECRWLLPTATPLRADGKGLGRWADGYVDIMVEAPSMRNIIDMGYLTDYRVFVPPSDFHRENIRISDSTGELNQDDARKETKRANITGDVVKHYLRIAPGKLGVTFAVDIEEATKIAAAFRDAGVPAEVVSSKTPDSLRDAILRRFKRREILQLVNVDLFGEGFDLPAIEVVSFARATESFALYCQQFGRALRLMIRPEWLKYWDTYDDATRRYFISISEKPKAIIIDHVGNVERHGLPDENRDWSIGLERRSSAGGKSDAILMTICKNKDVHNTGVACMKKYERFYSSCPYCGHTPVPKARSAPEFVDGDLFELDEATLTEMRSKIAKVDNPALIPYGATPEIEGAIKKRHWEHQQAQYDLRNQIAWWAGLAVAQGWGESESYRRFYLKFGVDVANARALGRREAEELSQRVAAELSKYNIDGRIDASIYFAGQLV